MHTGAWHGSLPLLRPAYDVLLFDYPVQGRSTAGAAPLRIDRLAAGLIPIADTLGIDRLHLVGTSYGGFVALDFARQFQARLHTLAISGILLSHEALFSLYQELSLRFYRGGPQAFELYTHYLYEKIFGERFVRAVGDKLERMRQGFQERWQNRVEGLVRLTLAQNPFFAELDANLEGYRAIQTPTLILAGAEDRTIPPWVQRKIVDVLPHCRYEEVPDCGHVVYVEQPARFFGAVMEWARQKGGAA
jgi:3-oxoadipate enol-lactonase